jgi:hypothetical protein
MRRLGRLNGARHGRRPLQRRDEGAIQVLGLGMNW